MTRPTSARAVLDEAARVNAELGHENEGSLSPARGFAPLAAPLLELPASHRAWDDVARDLPELYATLRLRSRLDALPALDADASALPEHCLQRAATVLGILVHAYRRVQPYDDAPAPAALERAWSDVSRRLGRPQPFLSYGDLILANWRHGAGSDALTAETLALLVPTVGTAAERVFYLVQFEMHVVGAPVVEACARAQTAIAHDDHAALIAELDRIAETLTSLIRDALPKIDPNPYSETHVDPVVWAKSVAPLAVPLREGVLGPSGTASPMFHTLDALFGRRRYRSALGSEAVALRAAYPPHWRRFVAAVAAIDLPGYVDGSRDRPLRTAFARAADLYSGAGGLLDRHRLKVSGYIETAFKLGRSVTIGGFSGTFADRPWQAIDDALVASLDERLRDAPASVHRVAVVSSEPAGDGARVSHVTLGTAGLGLRPAAGDRCLIFPAQDPALVERTLRALRARGDEPIGLDAAWRRALRAAGRDGVDRLAVRELLHGGELRPLRRRVAKILFELSGAEQLEDLIEDRAEDGWELPDALELLAAGGWDTAALLRGEPGERTSLCRVVAPVSPRTYSLSSDDGGAGDELHLTVAQLAYGARTSAPREIHGAASSYLVAGEDGRHMGLAVRRSARFALPKDPATPIVLIAGGSGVSPFRAFLQRRERTHAAGECRLLLGVRDSGELYYRAELERMLASMALHVTVAFSREDAAVEARRGPDGVRLVTVAGRRQRLGERLLEPEEVAALWRLAREPREGGAGAVVYVCGSASFAASIADAFGEVFRRNGDSSAGAALRLRRLRAQRRYVEEIFTTYTRPHEAVSRLVDASELARHAGGSRHPWLAIDGRVYDMTEFRELHPGGDVLIDAHAGTDATAAFKHARHHDHAEVASLLSLYEIAAIRRLRLGRSWSVCVGERGLEVVTLADLYREWVRVLYLTTELRNAVRADFSIRDRQTTRDRAAAETTPYTVQFCIEAHDRFLLNIEELLGSPLQRLWAMCAGICDERCDATELPRALRAVRDGDAARAAWATAAVLYAALERCVDDDAEPALGDLDRCCRQVMRVDGRLLAGIATTLRSGLRVFECHEAGAVRDGAAELRGALRMPVALLADHARRINDTVAALSRSLEPSPAGQTRARQRPPKS
jgi:sulfite reductase (NADPH) flavoprotein alpha-component